MKRFLLLAALCAIAYCAMAQVGTKFPSKDKFGNTLWRRRPLLGEAAVY